MIGHFLLSLSAGGSEIYKVGMFSINNWANNHLFLIDFEVSVFLSSLSDQDVPKSKSENNTFSTLINRTVLFAIDFETVSH